MAAAPRRSTRVKKYELPTIDRAFFRRPLAVADSEVRVAEADARWAATFGRGFLSKADSDFVEWRGGFQLRNVKGVGAGTVDGWFPVPRAFDSDVLHWRDFAPPHSYGDAEERREFGVDDVVFYVLRHAS